MAQFNVISMNRIEFECNAVWKHFWNGNTNGDGYFVLISIAIHPRATVVDRCRCTKTQKMKIKIIEQLIAIFDVIKSITQLSQINCDTIRSNIKATARDTQRKNNYRPSSVRESQKPKHFHVIAVWHLLPARYIFCSLWETKCAVKWKETITQCQMPVNFQNEQIENQPCVLCLFILPLNSVSIFLSPSLALVFALFDNYPIENHWNEHWASVYLRQPNCSTGLFSIRLHQDNAT